MLDENRSRQEAPAPSPNGRGHAWKSTRVFLTDSLHHAGLSGVGLHRNDVLEAVQRDDALARLPHLEDVLHLGAQSLPHRAKTQQL